MLRRLDWQLNTAVIFLAAASLLILFSSSPQLFWRQLIWYVSGAAIALFFSGIDWRWLANQEWLRKGIYGITLLALIATYFFAPPIRHVRSWLVLGPIQIQFSELAKLSLILIYAGFFSRRHLETSLLRNLLHSFFYLAPVILLVALQPDLGTAIILLGIWAGFVLASGITKRQILTGLLILILLFVAGWFGFLAQYQKARIVSFIFPETDPLGVSYSVIQSKIAIGSAGFFGKGFGRGTQVQLGFLPEAPTDFIFAAFTEEWGLLGGALAVLAFTVMIYRIIRIGIKTGGNYAKFICLGTATVIIFQFVLNLGSNLGFLPVVGVPLPFFSYGGSSLLTFFILLGIIQNIARESSF